MILYGWPELVASVGGEKRKDTILSNMFVGVLRVDEGFDGFVDEELDGFIEGYLSDGMDWWYDKEIVRGLARALLEHFGNQYETH